MNYLKIQNGRHLGHFLPHYFFDIRNNAVKALIFFIPEGGLRSPMKLWSALFMQQNWILEPALYKIEQLLPPLPLLINLSLHVIVRFIYYHEFWGHSNITWRFVEQFLPPPAPGDSFLCIELFLRHTQHFFQAAAPPIEIDIRQSIKNIQKTFHSWISLFKLIFKYKVTY